MLEASEMTLYYYACAPICMRVMLVGLCFYVMVILRTLVVADAKHGYVGKYKGCLHSKSLEQGTACLRVAIKDVS